MAAIADQIASTLAQPADESPMRRAWRRLLRRKSAVLGLVIVVLLVFVAILAPLIAPFDPAQQAYAYVRKPPSLRNWFGTDESGRDLFSRVIFGARASLLAGVVSVAIAVSIGVPVGMLAGYRGGLTDALISRITDAMLAIPFLILAIALAAFLGPSLTNAMIAIGVTATADARTGAGGKNRGLCGGGARGRQRPIPHRFSAHVAEHCASFAGAGVADGRCGDHCRSLVELPRVGPTAARSLMGLDAEYGATLSHQRAMDGDLARPRDFPRSAIVQLAR